jgi:hypothetical protein
MRRTCKQVALLGWLGVALGLALAGCNGTDPAGPITGPEAVTLATVQNSVFSPSCALSNCHIGPGAPFGLDLSQGHAMANLRNVPSAEIPQYDRVEPGRAFESYLYMKVTADERIAGDPMPLVGGPLSSGQLDLLRRWIEDGANP